eukprot:7377950-Prymnesium_polylepis.1
MMHCSNRPWPFSSFFVSDSPAIATNVRRADVNRSAAARVPAPAAASARPAISRAASSEIDALHKTCTATPQNLPRAAKLAACPIPTRARPSDFEK